MTNEPAPVRVVRGAPTDAELAAVIVALTAVISRGRRTAPPPAPPVSRWARAARPTR